MSNQNTWAIACTCDAIKIGISGAAAVSAFFHCENCSHWTGDAEVASVAVWDPECVEFIMGKDSIVVEKDLGDEQHIDRYCCPTCSDVIYAINHLYNLTAIRHDVIAKSYGGELPPELLPTLHFYYEDRVKDMKDNLPKFKDFPTEGGGSGAMMDNCGKIIATE